MPHHPPLADPSTGQPPPQMAEETVISIMIRAHAAKLDTGNVAALAALDLITGLAVFGRAPLEVIMDTLAEPARRGRFSCATPGTTTNVRRRSAPHS